MAGELAIGMSNVYVTSQVKSEQNNVEQISDDDSELNVNSNRAIDMDESFSEHNDDIKPVVEFPPMVVPSMAIPSMAAGQKKKSPEREVKHRNTGKIGLANLPRRRLLSVSAESASAYFQRRIHQNRLGEQQNRPQLVHRTPPPAPSHTVFVRSIPYHQLQSNYQLEPVAATYGQGADGVASNVANSPREKSEPEESDDENHQQQQPPQQQQPSQQQQQLQELLRLMNNESFCVICQQQYTSRKGLAVHRKTQKHESNLRNMDSARRQLLDLALAQARANPTNQQ